MTIYGKAASIVGTSRLKSPGRLTKPNSHKHSENSNREGASEAVMMHESVKPTKLNESMKTCSLKLLYVPLDRLCA